MMDPSTGGANAGGVGRPGPGSTKTGGAVGEPPRMGERRVHVLVTGDVQGVFFRDAAKKQAETFNVTGWIKNLSDGRVEAVFEGTDYAVDRMISWCHEGSGKAKVRYVEVREEEPKHHARGFEVRR